MHRRWWGGMGTSLALAIVAGCLGEDPDVSASKEDAGVPGADGGPSDDASPQVEGGADPSTDAPSTPVDAGCETIVGNMLANGSFEDGTLGWDTDGLLAKRTDGPAHCLAFVEFVATHAYGRVAQEFEVASTGTPGEQVVLEFGASIRGLDPAQLEPVAVILANVDDTAQRIAYTPVLKADGEWVTASETITVTPGTGFYLRVQSEQIRKVGVDRAWVVRKN